MKAAVYRAPGSPDVFVIEDVAEPEPAPDELLIRVEAICIEPGDLMRRRLIHPDPNRIVPGSCAAGVVVDIGHLATGFAVGERVTSFAYDGAYAELRAIAARQCYRVPDGIDMGVAAAVPVAFGTAAYGLRLGSARARDVVLILGATGGVGMAMVQLARRAGARVIGTARHADVLEKLDRYGLHAAIVTGTEDVAEKVRALTDGIGADLLLDNIGGDALAGGLDALREGGRAVIVGIAGPGSKMIDTTKLLLQRLSVFGCFVGPIFAEPEIRTFIEEALTDVARGKLEIAVDTHFPLHAMADAHAHAEKPGRWGRVIVTV